VDRDAIARAGRRAEVLDALAFEREREAALRAQIGELVLEEDGPRIDREAFVHLSPAEIAAVRDALGQFDDPPHDLDDDPFADPDSFFVQLDGEQAGEPESENELGRLEAAIAVCRTRQGALARYLEALDLPGEAEREPK